MPEWLVRRISATCPREDRVEGRRVFQGLDEQAIKRAMAAACKTAGIAHYHPHDLRHRRLTVWHHEGVPLKVMAERAGHSQATITLDTYSHVMPLHDASPASLEAALGS